MLSSVPGAWILQAGYPGPLLLPPRGRGGYCLTRPWYHMVLMVPRVKLFLVLSFLNHPLLLSLLSHFCLLWYLVLPDPVPLRGCARGMVSSRLVSLCTPLGFCLPLLC